MGDPSCFSSAVAAGALEGGRRGGGSPILSLGLLQGLGFIKN